MSAKCVQNSNIINCILILKFSPSACNHPQPLAYCIQSRFEVGNAKNQHFIISDSFRENEQFRDLIILENSSASFG
jgi:hypothetical protein